MKIRITDKGIYGAPATDENPSGEYPVGHEIDLGKNDPPAGWSGRYVEVGAKAHKDATPVTNEVPDDSAERGTESKDQDDQPRRARPAKD